MNCLTIPSILQGTFLAILASIPCRIHPMCPFSYGNSLNMMIVMGAIYGVVRTVGAIGLLKNKMWGFMLSVINCTITMALMMFLLPAGIMDGVFAGSALILMLTQYYGNKEIVSN